MFSVCANPDCQVSFNYREGRFFRFRKAPLPGEKRPNTHSVQHLWLCGTCAHQLTLRFVEGRGILVEPRLDLAYQDAGKSLEAV